MTTVRKRLGRWIRAFLAVGAVAWSGIHVSRSADAEAKAPSEVMNFALLDHRGTMHELRRASGDAVVLFFVQPGCPVVQQNSAKIRALHDEYRTRGVQFWLVCSSTSEDRKSLAKDARELGVWHMPILHDDLQGVARHLGVKRTAEAVAIRTKDWSIFYRGAVDDQMVEGAQKPKPENQYLRQALDEALLGKTVRTPRTVSRGCLIHFDAGDAPDSAAVDYAKEVAPILKARCVACHSPGNIGAGAMTNHKRVKGMSSMIEEVLLAKRMPPWDADPNIGKFSNHLKLPPAEGRTLLRWVRQGAPRGEGPDPLESDVPQPAADWPLGTPDIVLKLPAPEKIPATGVLDYRHIEVSANNAESGWVGAVWVKPGNRRVVHHVIARLKDGGQKDHLGSDEMFAGWAPGSTQEWLPKGSGKFLPKNARFDLEMHYTTCGSEQTDQTEVGIYFSRDPVNTRYETVPLVNSSFEVPPGDPNSKTEARYCFRDNATLHSVTPHMHLRGKWMKFELLFPDGKQETVCSVPRYDFNWQLTYVLEKPKKIPAGTWAILTGGFDNSARNPSNPDPKKAVHWGEQSWDEMFLGWYNVVWQPSEGKDSSKKTAAAAKTK